MSSGERRRGKIPGQKPQTASDQSFKPAGL